MRPNAVTADAAVVHSAIAQAKEHSGRIVYVWRGSPDGRLHHGLTITGKGHVTKMFAVDNNGELISIDGPMNDN